MYGGGPAGVWQVTGSDTRGSYAGNVEVIIDGQAFAFTRVIHYDTVTVEDARELWWVWQGKLVPNSADFDASENAELAASFSLRKADFIKSRGASMRTPADMVPVPGTGKITAIVGGWSASWTGDGIDGSETWTTLVPSGATPIFALEQGLVPAHAPPDASTKNTLFSTFSLFQQLPTVAPYASHPMFQAAVHYHDVDHTDYVFYQQHPKALRVVNKIIDPISLQETLARANAFKWTLADKAAYFDADMPTNLIDPVAHMAAAYNQNGMRVPSGDSALWTSAWVGSQAFRYKVTGDPAVLDQMAPSVDAINTLVNIVRASGNTTDFARTLQPHGLTPGSIWVQGTGPYAHLDWMVGGNNDMFKGLLYSNLTGYLALCDPPTGHDATCARIRQTVRYMADDLSITQTSGNNKLDALWLAAYVTGDANYAARAGSEWLVHAAAVKQGNSMTYTNGISDWSGTNLNWVQYVLMTLLQQKVDLGFTNEPPMLAIQAGIDALKGGFHGQYMGAWSLAFAAFSSVPDPADATNMRWRLREVPAPKTQADIDHRVSDSFVMSPYPEVPWKFDWLTSERTQSLISYPLFERTPTDYAWAENPHAYTVDSVGLQLPSSDYLHLYWLARWLGVLSPTE